MSSLAARLAEAAGEAQSAPLRAVPSAPRGWEPGVRYEPDGTQLVTTPPSDALEGGESEWRKAVEEMGLTVPAGYRVRLVEAKHDPAAWARAAEDRGKAHSAYTVAVWRLRFAVEPDPGQATDTDLEDIAALIKSHKRKPPKSRDGKPSSLVVVWADPQTGKTGSLGGTDQLVDRVLTRLDGLEDRVRDLRRIGYDLNTGYWLDAGDSVEGFSNAVAQHQTNDLAMTRQIRVSRRLALEGIGRMARAFPRVVAASCGSNHCQVRVGKDRAADPGDDWGIEILTQIADAYALNPETYGHVSFVTPDRWRESLALDIEGVKVGLAHGHQVGRPDRIPDWWRGQSHGDLPVADADILITGHFHSLRVQHTGNGRTWIQAPTLDNGSDWYANISGEQSRPGLLTFVVTADGWEQLHVL